MWSKKAIRYLDKYYPPSGKCWFCGHKDKRHRLWDAIIYFSDAGHSLDEIMEEYPDETLEHIEAVLMIRPYFKGGFIPDEPDNENFATMKDLAMALGDSEAEAERKEIELTSILNGMPKIVDNT